MFCLIKILFIIVLINCINCTKYNVSYEGKSIKIVRNKYLHKTVSLELATCKEFDAVSGYGYQTYFKIDKINGTRSFGYMINIKLFILAGRDAHILLSPEENPPSANGVYEIGKFYFIIHYTLFYYFFSKSYYK